MAVPYDQNGREITGKSKPLKEYRVPKKRVESDDSMFQWPAREPLSIELLGDQHDVK